MKYIHKINSEMMHNLKNMLKSESEQDMELAVEILNNADIGDTETHHNIELIISDYNTNLLFDLTEPDNVITFKFYTRRQWNNYLKTRDSYIKNITLI